MSEPRATTSRVVACGIIAHQLAHAALAAASNSAIGVAPRFEVPSCDVFAAAPHMTAKGSAIAAEIIGKHYAAERR
jgi:hypothetical protein